jgi:glycosyltransferase involved in cell wall biosynthesis
MRIVHVITRGDVGGAQTHVVELSGAQLARGDEVFVVAGTDGPAARRAADRGVDVQIVPSLGRARSGLGMRHAYDDVRTVVGAIGPDVVHGHSSHAGLFARVVARRSGRASVYTAHGWPFQAGAAWTQRVSSFAGEFVGGHLGDAVICLTAAEAERARRARVVPADRLFVVPNGIGDVAPSLIRTARGRARSIVMVARFAAPKRQRQLVEAMTAVTSDEWMLTLVGDGPQLDQCRTFGRRSLGDRVRFLGHRDDVSAILCESDIAVLWSAYEGLPISLMEAMRAGLCCIASDLPGVRELFGEPPCGLTAGSEAELSEAISKALDDPSLVGALGSAGRTRFEQHYTAEAMERSTRAVYDAVQDRRST